MHMSDIKLFGKNENELETLIQKIRIYCQDVEKEFGTEKCALLIMRSGKNNNGRNRTVKSRKK